MQILIEKCKIPLLEQILLVISNNLTTHRYAVSVNFDFTVNIIMIINDKNITH